MKFMKKGGMRVEWLWPVTDYVLAVIAVGVAVVIFFYLAELATK